MREPLSWTEVKPGMWEATDKHGRRWRAWRLYEGSWRAGLIDERGHLYPLRRHADVRTGRRAMRSWRSRLGATFAVEDHAFRVPPLSAPSSSSTGNPDG